MQTTATYNGYTLEQLKPLIAHFAPIHQAQYLQNAARVIDCLRTGYNLNEVESLKYSNFLLVNLYITETN